MIVPVLSKQQMSTRPAKGMRKGSVQKMAAIARQSQFAAEFESGAERTVLGKGDEGSVDGERELHGKLGRDDRSDNDNAVEKELRPLAILLHTCSPERAHQFPLSPEFQREQTHP